jgi:serine/threonine protein kinase
MTSSSVAVGRPLRASDPTELGPYKLLRRIGEGGMGSVYLAERSENPGKFVALKVIRRDLSSDPDFRRRFRSEVARAQQVPAFCTAEVLDADPDHDPPYLVVEFVNGPSLAKVVQNQGPLSPANLHGLAIGVATALCAIHGAGVIHRDLKPANVLLALGSPKVIDFGIARATEGGTLTDTGSNQLVGTIAYMAPERLDTERHTPVTPAADIFAWGAVVAFAGTGRTPFGGNGVEVAAKILSQPPDLDGLSSDLRALVERALAKDPAQRPTARELLDQLVGPKQNTVDLVEAGSQRAVVSVPAATDTTRFHPIPLLPVRPQKRRILVPLLTVGVVMLTAAVVGLMTGRIRPLWADNPPPSSSATPTPTAPVSAPALATRGALLVDQSLITPGSLFRNGESADYKAKCTLEGGLVVTKGDGGTYRCPSDLWSMDDFALQVDVTTRKPGSCAAIWMRNTSFMAYRLSICADRYMIGNHAKDDYTNLMTWPLPPIPVKTSFRVLIEMHGTELTFYRNGQRVGSISNPAYAEGSVVLGMSTSSGGDPGQGYCVVFQDLKIWELS